MAELIQSNYSGALGPRYARRLPASEERPRVSTCTDLWLHDTPLLEALVENYGHRRLDGLGGSHGWLVEIDRLPDE